MLRAAPSIIQRDRLLDLIDQPNLAPVTLITAPAGYGKTTLGRQWAARQTTARCGWVVFEPAYNTQELLLASLWDAVNEASGEHVPYPDVLDVETILARLWSHPGPVALILDDFHLVDSESARQSVEVLVRDLPAHAHCVILSRQLPELGLARLFVYGNVRHLTQHDLAFSQDEVRAVFASSDLTEDRLTRLTERSEGWIAGLHLMVMSAQATGVDIDNHLDRLIDGHTDDRWLNDFIIEEVLNALPSELRQFVLDSCVLESLEPDLCDVALGITTSANALDRLESSIVFVSRPGGSRRPLVYHRLFAECVQRVRSRFPEATPASEIRLRAAHWCRAEGRAFQAAEYAIQAEAWDTALGIISEFFNRTDHHAYSREVSFWLDRLPLPILAANSQLLHWNIVEYFYAGHVDGSRELVERYASAFTASGVPADQAWHAIHLAYLAIVDDDPACALDICQRALPLLSEDAVNERLLLHSGVLQAARAVGEHDLADDALRQAEACRFQIRDEPHIWHFRIEPEIANHALIQGDLLGAEQLLSHFIARYPDQFRESVGNLRYRLTHVYIERDQLDRAERQAEAVARPMAHRRHASWYVDAYLARARLHDARGDAARAWMMLQLAQERSRSYGGLRQIRQAQTNVAQFWIDTGKYNLARAWLNRTDLPALPIRDFGDIDPRTIRLQILLLDDRLEDAEQLVLEAIEQARTLRHRVAEITWSVWGSIVANARGEHDTGRERLRHALEAGAPNGFVRAFSPAGHDLRRNIRELLPSVSDAARPHAAALAGIDDEAPPPVPSREFAAGNLTRREREVLAQLATGKTNREIADALFITERTVKKHLANLFRKTGATNRTAVVLWAHEQVSVSG